MQTVIQPTLCHPSYQKVSPTYAVILRFSAPSSSLTEASEHLMGHVQRDETCQWVIIIPKPSYNFMYVIYSGSRIGQSRSLPSEVEVEVAEWIVLDAVSTDHRERLCGPKLESTMGTFVLSADYDRYLPTLDRTERGDQKCRGTSFLSGVLCFSWGSSALLDICSLTLPSFRESSFHI